MGTFNLHDLRFGHSDGAGGAVILFTELGGIVAGTAECVITGQRMLLDYIGVSEYLRRQGVGTVLLKETIDFAKKKGLQEIWGTLMPVHDTWLKAWFTRHGFELHPPTPENTPGAAYALRRRL